MTAGLEKIFRYRASAMRGDYARAALGLLLTAGPLAAVNAGQVGTAVLGGLALLFLLFGVRTGVRQLSRYRMDENGIAVDGPIEKRLAWRDVASVGLSYYTTRRSGGEGWMQLKLKGGRVTFRIESTLDGFTEIVERSCREAVERGIDMDRATINNMKALGITPRSNPSPAGAHDRPVDSSRP